MTTFCSQVKQMLKRQMVFSYSLWRIVYSAIRLVGIEGYPIGDGHDKNHIFRVMSYAIRISKVEGGDIVVILVSAIMHDIHRHVGDGRLTPKDVTHVVRQILEQISELSKQRKALVMKVVLEHETYHWDSLDKCLDDIEVKIVRDADRLDAMGAIGCGRTFAYGALHGIPEYDLSVKILKSNYKYDDYDVSTVHHLYHKLFNLDKTLHTDTARNMAKPKMKFIKMFAREYIKEIQEV